MSAITINELKAKISSDSDIIASLSKSISVSMRYQSILFRSLILAMWGRKLLKSINKIDAMCFECADKCENDFEFRHDLEKAIVTWNATLEKKEQMKMPKLLIRWERNIVDEFESKLENYWLASDVEIKQLANSISDKMNKRHAKHAIY